MDGIINGVAYPILRANSASSGWVLRQEPNKLYVVNEDLTVGVVETDITADKIKEYLHLPESYNLELHTTTVTQNNIYAMKIKFEPQQ